jgi:hypothetical protein
MSRRFPAVQQARPCKQHRSSANRADSPDPPCYASQPVDDLYPSLVIFHRISAGDQQRVDITSNAAKGFVRHNLQAAICYE